MDKTVHGQLRSAVRTAINLLFVLVAILAVIYFLSGIYSIENNEVGVLQRFGRIIDANVQPGIHYALPWPVDKVSKVPFPKVERIHLKDFSRNFTFGVDGLSFTSLTGLGTYVVTGDNNLVNIECILQYEVRDPVSYLFNLGESVDKSEGSARRFLTEMACSTILHALAEMRVDDALTTKKDRIIQYVKQKLQQRLNELETGLAVTFVEIRELGPPAVVKEYFEDVVRAKVDKDTAIKNAETYLEQETRAANGRAARLRAEAEGYFSEVTQNAEGEARRFIEQLAEYRKDKLLTRYRLYMETLQEVLASVGRLDILDTSKGRKPAAIKLIK
jgi:membrane protease subunit HflK